MKFTKTERNGPMRSAGERRWAHAAVIALLATACFAGEQASESPARLKVAGKEILAPDGTAIRLRGFNLLWWGPPTAQDVADIKALGANSVRYMFGYEPKGTFDPMQLKFLDDHIRLFTSQKLWVIVTIHQFDRKNGNETRGPYSDAELQREFLTLWTYVIKRFRNEPYIAAWEPINEPHDVAKEVLRPWYQDVIKHVRALDARTPIVVEGTNYSYPKDLGEHMKFDDPSIIYAFHMYVPFDYTHQKKENPLIYPSEKWDLAFLEKEMQPAFTFGETHKVPVYCGEFGVLTRAPGYERWLQDAAAILEKHGTHWSHWAWMVKPKEPVNESFDCNKQKTGIHETMKGIFEGTRAR